MTSIAADAATIVNVSPQGEVAQVRQLAVTFSDAVVAFGDPRLPDPMGVSCAGASARGTGLWTSDRHWVFNFEQPLPPGVRCVAQVRTDWKPRVAGAAADAALTGTSSFSFSTGGPAVESIQPFDGATIEEDQHFLIDINGAATDSSVAAHAWCEVEGLGDRLPVRIVTGALRERIVAAAGPRALKDAKREAERQSRLIVLTCPRPLPSDTPMRLVWGRGIAAAVNPGVATRVEQRFAYRVRPAFKAEFSCERERATAPCLPIRPLVLRFSAPIDRKLAEQVRLVPAGGKSIAPVFDKDDKDPEVSSITLALRVAENAAYTVELPSNLKDAAGRVLANAGAFPMKVSTGDAPPIAKFPAAPFGIVERFGDASSPGAASAPPPMLPLTLRHVQGDLRSSAPGGAVRVKRLQSDAEMLAWYDKLHRFHESELSAQEAGLPKAQWVTTESLVDERGRSTRQQVERRVQTRTLSLLKADTSAKRLDLPQLNGGDPRPFEVVGLPLAEPGYHVVEIESARLGQSLLDPRAPMYVRTGVLVTNLGVHVKLGRENSAVWVTSLDRGRPVEGADVAINDCFGKRLWAGRTDARGLAIVKLALDLQVGECPNEAGYFVTARKADADPRAPQVIDTAFVFTSWQKGIEPWRFNLPTGNGSERDAVAHTVFDRTLLRAGETVSMKHFLRAETSAGLAPWDAASLPTRIKIVHQGSGQQIVQPLLWNGTRHALSTWNIPPAAKLGLYEVMLERDVVNERHRSSWSSGSFRVEEFRLPLVDARLSGPSQVPIAPRELPLSVQMAYLSGGAMAKSPAAVSALLKPHVPAFPGHDGFSFEPPREAAADGDSEDEAATAQGADRLVADKLPLTTDAQGAATVLLKDLPPLTRPSELHSELTYTDPNGEIQTVSSRIDLWPSAVVLGIKTRAWASQRGGSVQFNVLALDTRGQPIRGQRVEVRGRLSQTLSNRTRIVGGFYAYDNRTELKDLGVVCSGSTDERGGLACDATLSAAGQVELIAQAKDAAGRTAQAATGVWITKQGELWFGQDNDDRIDLLPEKPRYESGETARLQVRMPYREATALVTVEREGLLDTRVVTLRGDDPTLSIKIEKSWGPNVYVGVLALRGRLREVPWYSFFTWGWKEPLSWARSFWYDGREYQAPTAMVDLAKPSFKFGVAALQVGIAAHELKVSVTTDRPQYAVRQKVQARIKVTQSADGQIPAPAGTEVAFAAVDESLLELRPNESWDLLNGMIRSRAWGVETSTAQGEIIGRRHYGRKAVAAGGGGGRGGTRELFDTLLLWKAVVVLDARGEATVEVPLNDSLTRFRLVAIADGPVDAATPTFGTGSTTVRVTQDLQLLAGLPPLVRGGDRFSALLTLRNTTAREMKVRATLAGTANGGATEIVRTPLSFAPQDMLLPAGSAKEIAWPVEVPIDAFSIVWDAAVETVAASGAAAANDRIKVTQLVAEAVPVRVMQATIARLDGPYSLPVAAPAEALPESGVKRGGLRIALQPRLGSALPGLRRYFETYPYSCLEQKAAKALGLGDAALWSTLVEMLPTYLDADGLASYFPPRPGDAPAGNDRLTAQLVATAHEAGYALPDAARNAMLAGLTAFVEGRIERRLWAPASAQGMNLAVRKLAALDALARHGRVQARMLGSINATPQLWPTAAVIDWFNLLRRLRAQDIAVPDHVRRIEQAQQIVRSRLALGGTTLKFSDEAGDHWWWLMDSADANAARLILAVLDEPAWRDELPRLVVGALGRQRDGAWSTTTANLWGAIALDKFSAKFESQALTGSSTVRIDAKPSGAASTAPALAAGAVDWTKQPAGGSVTLPWPAAPATLSVHQQGRGAPWLTVQSLAAIAPKGPVRAGYGLTRHITAVSRKDPSRWSRGDVLRVRLEIDAQTDMSWVVVSDPVPGGATLLGSGLGRDSAIAAQSRSSEADTDFGDAWTAYDERSFEAFRRYYGQLPRGRHVVEYTLRLNAAGRFALPPTRIEAMYAPETFGELPNVAIDVAP
ncbi:MAG: MG2 domain-containing protein [Burkholderiaceae bacterium]|nr:MG2 domain-containing protein [Burkholderiaceae bacterium]